MHHRLTHTRLAATLLAVLAVAPPLASARAVGSETIAPGGALYHVCGSGYEPAARQHPVSLNGTVLEVRKVKKTATGQRVVFSHRVQIFDESHHEFRLILNRGRNAVDYLNDCRQEG
jgi:hypothetical protein